MQYEYYKSNITGKLFSKLIRDYIDCAFGNGTFKKYLENGTFIVVKNPSVMDCIVYGDKTLAVIRYREIHNCSLKEANEFVDEAYDFWQRNKTE